MKKSIKIITLAVLVCLTSWVQAVTIDIGFLYDSGAAANTQNIDTKINHLIANANRVYRDNGLGITLRLAGKKSIGNVSVKPTQEWLNYLISHGWVQNKRDEWKADMMTVLSAPHITGTPENKYYNCGYAHIGKGRNGQFESGTDKMMYSIVAIGCGVDQTMFIHELGHNMGLKHSRAQGETTGGVYVDGMGHGVLNDFATIMAYPHFYGNATRIDYFSHAQWTVNGKRVGVEGESFAWKTVNATKESISQFR